jgi:hypothetical protein
VGGGVNGLADSGQLRYLDPSLAAQQGQAAAAAQGGGGASRQGAGQGVQGAQGQGQSREAAGGGGASNPALRDMLAAIGSNSLTLGLIGGSEGLAAMQQAGAGAGGGAGGTGGPDGGQAGGGGGGGAGGPQLPGLGPAGGLLQAMQQAWGASWQADPPPPPAARGVPTDPLYSAYRAAGGSAAGGSAAGGSAGDLAVGGQGGAAVDAGSYEYDDTGALAGREWACLARPIRAWDTAGAEPHAHAGAVGGCATGPPPRVAQGLWAAVCRGPCPQTSSSAGTPWGLARRAAWAAGAARVASTPPPRRSTPPRSSSPSASPRHSSYARTATPSPFWVS